MGIPFCCFTFQYFSVKYSFIKKWAIIKKIFRLLTLSIHFFICTFSHKIVHIISMIIINKQLNSTNENYRREKKLLRKYKLP